MASLTQWGACAYHLWVGTCHAQCWWPGSSRVDHSAPHFLSCACSPAWLVDQLLCWRLSTHPHHSGRQWEHTLTHVSVVVFLKFEYMYHRMWCLLSAIHSLRLLTLHERSRPHAVLITVFNSNIAENTTNNTANQCSRPHSVSSYCFQQQCSLKYN